MGFLEVTQESFETSFEYIPEILCGHFSFFCVCVCFFFVVFVCFVFFVAC